MASLKRVVASLFILGLVGGSVLATEMYPMNSDAFSNKMGAPLYQNRAGGNGYDGPFADYFNRIRFSGQANIDGAIANRSPTAIVNTSVNNSANDIFLNNASLLMDANVNEWVGGHVHLLYGQNSHPFLRFSANQAVSADAGMSRILDEAIVTIGNASRSPFYFQAGHEYVPFGDYNRFAMTNMVQSTTQLLSMTRGTAAQVGFVDASGFNGALYLFRGIQQVGTPASVIRTQNWGANLAYALVNDTFGYKLGVGYLRNMADVNYINTTGPVATTIAGVTTTSTGLGGGINRFNNRVGGFAADAGMNWMPFDIALHFVTAVQTFAATDVPYVNGATISGAKPAAWGVDAGFSFPTMNRSSRIGIGYQGTKQANTLGVVTGTADVTGLPKTRFLANYVVNLSRCTDFGFEVFNDRGYNTNNGGSGSNATAGVVRLGVKFS